MKRWIIAILCVSGMCQAQITLSAQKSGSADVALSWNSLGGGHVMTLAKDVVPQFSHPIAMLKNSTNTSYTYVGAQTNGLVLECFLIFDNIEDSEYYDTLPPEAPTITSINPSIIKVGDTLTIAGTGFSTIPQENQVIFENGVWMQGVTATTTQVTTSIPRGAASGKIAVCNGLYCSDPSYDIHITNQWTSIRSMWYNNALDDWWLAGNYGGQKVMNYNYSSNIWTGTNEQPAGDTYAYMCGQGADASGRMPCAITTGAPGGGTKVVQTNPPGLVSTCRTLGQGSQTKVVGAAADASNFYFAFNDTTNIPAITGVKKVTSDCVTILNNNYGNFSSLVVNTINGITLDKFGNLYVPSMTEIYKVPNATTNQSIASGFAGLFGLAYDSAGPNDNGVLAAADYNGQGIWMVDLNLTAPNNKFKVCGTNALTPCPGASFRSVGFGKEPYHAAWVETDAKNTRIFVSEPTGKSRMQGDPFIIISPVMPPNDTNLPVYITKNNPDDSYPGTWQTADGIAKVTATFRDGAARIFCARIIDAPDTSGYAPQNPCPHPWLACDNNDPSQFQSSGPGTFLDNDAQIFCTPTAVTSHTFHFRITNRYAGDNYQVEFGLADFQADATATVLARSPVLTAYKRISIERDLMFRKGGLLAENANVTDTSVILAKNSDMSRADNLENDLCHHVAIFDTDKPYQPTSESFYIKYSSETSWGATFNLYSNSTCITQYQIANSTGYDASEPDSFSHEFTFLTGKSAGIGVLDSGYYNQPFDGIALHEAYTKDAFISIQLFGEGTSYLPYLPEPFFIGYPDPRWVSKHTFHQHWFFHRTADPPTRDNDNINYLHIISGSFSSTNIGETLPSSNSTFVYHGTIEAPTVCFYDELADVLCAGPEIRNYKLWAVLHEIAHHFGVNACDAANHDNNNAWCGSVGGQCVNANAYCQNKQWCLMNTDQADWNLSICQRTSGIHKFDCNDYSGKFLTGSPFCTSPECACPTPPCNDVSQSSSLRTTANPV